MWSFGAEKVRGGKCMPTFEVEDKVYHRIGGLLHSSQQNSSFLQIYFVGSDEKESEIRSNIFTDVKPWLVLQIQKFCTIIILSYEILNSDGESPRRSIKFKVVINTN